MQYFTRLKIPIICMLFTVVYLIVIMLVITKHKIKLLFLPQMDK